MSTAEETRIADLEADVRRYKAALYNMEGQWRALLDVDSNGGRSQREREALKQVSELNR